MDLFKGKINRKSYLLAIVGFTLVAVLIHYILIYLHPMLGLSDIWHIAIKSILSFIFLAAFMPFCIKRMNDIDMSKWWVLVFWLEAIFSLRNIVLIDLAWGIKVEPFSWPLVILAFVSLILGLVIAFKPGTHNNTLNNDLGDASRPSAR